MPKSFTLGNGSMMIGLDQFGQIQDFYYPYVGLENQSGGHHVHKIGIHVDNQFSWLDDGSWQTEIIGNPNAMVSNIIARSARFELSIQFEDVVYNEQNIFVRKISLQNHSMRSRSVKIFFNQQFEIYGSRRGDTAFYHPKDNVLVHYKGQRVFLVNLRNGDLGLDDHSIGLMGIEGREGTFKDAEDSVLSKNSIEHGLVDSVIASTVDLSGDTTHVMYFWITAAASLPEAQG
jgi:glucoamylase